MGQSPFSLLWCSEILQLCTNLCEEAWFGLIVLSFNAFILVCCQRGQTHWDGKYVLITQKQEEIYEILRYINIYYTRPKYHSTEISNTLNIWNIKKNGCQWIEVHCCFCVCLLWAGDKYKKKIVWFISLVKLHNLEYSIELPVQNLKLSITLSLPKYKIFKLLRSLRYVYKSSCCVWLFCFQLWVLRDYRPRTRLVPVIPMSRSRWERLNGGPRPSLETSTRCGMRSSTCECYLFFLLLSTYNNPQ